MNKLFFIFILFASFNLIAQDNADLIYDKIDRQTPANVNDDHMVVRKIKKSEMDNLAVSGGNIYFEIDKSDIVPTEMIKIDEISKALSKLGSRVEKVVIEGYASRDGDPTKNFDLGIERAKSVKIALIKNDVSEGIIETYSYGDESMYRFQNISKNRRAQIKIHIRKNN